LYLEAKRNYLFSSGFDKNINIWELKKNKVQLGGQLIGHRKKVNGVAYQAERKQVISGGDDGDIFVWDPATGKPSFVVHGAHDGPIEHMHWEEDHKLLITCGQDLTIKLWRFRKDPNQVVDSLSASAELWKRSGSDNRPSEEGNVEAEPTTPTSTCTSSIYAEFESQSDGRFEGFRRTASSFVHAFLSCRSLTLDNASRLVQSILTTFDQHLHNVEQWQDATEEVTMEIMEAIEAHIMTRLRFRVFGTSTADQEQDAALQKRLRQLAFIQPDHLEISPEILLDTSTFERAKQALCQIGHHKTPAEKVNSVMKCCVAIHDLIRESKEASLRKTSRGELDEQTLLVKAQKAAASAGADEFLPIFIYVVLKANPKQLHSSIHFVMRFRYILRMGSEGGCFFTHLSSAVYFLENLTAESLNIDAETYDYYINGCKATGLRVAAPPQETQKLFDDLESDKVETSAGGDLFLPEHEKVVPRQLRSLPHELKSGPPEPPSGVTLRGEESAGMERPSLFSEEEKHEDESLPPPEATWMALLGTMDGDLDSENLFAGMMQEEQALVEPHQPGSPQRDGVDENSITSPEADGEMSALLREVQEGLDSPLFEETRSRAATVESFPNTGQEVDPVQQVITVQNDQQESTECHLVEEEHPDVKDIPIDTFLLEPEEPCTCRSTIDDPAAVILNSDIDDSTQNESRSPISIPPSSNGSQSPKTPSPTGKGSGLEEEISPSLKTGSLTAFFEVNNIDMISMCDVPFLEHLFNILDCQTYSAYVPIPFCRKRLPRKPVHLKQ